MENWKRLLILIVGSVLGLGLLGLILGIVMSHFIVEYWWHQDLGFRELFLLKISYRYILAAVITLFFFLIFFLNFWAASRYLGANTDNLDRLGRSERNRYLNWLNRLESGSLPVNAALSFILAVLIALPFYKQWEQALLFIFGPSAGVTDPVFGRDISFYLFSYPMYQLIQLELLIAFGVLTLALALIYGLQHQIMPDRIKEWPNGVRVHMTAVVIVTALIVVWGFMLQRYELLYTDVHDPQFFGPGFIEIRYILPLIWLSIVALLGAVLAGLFYLHTGRGLMAFLGVAIVFVLSLGIRQLHAIPNVISRFIVQPNPVRTEREFMANNIEATLSAYDLKNVKVIDMDPGTPDQDVVDPELRSHLYNIPVWDPEYLDDVYQQMQAIRPYYRFTHVDVARYMVNNRLEQVNLAPRELDIAPLPSAAKNWENIHLRYTHGYGAVVTPTAQDGEQPMDWYLRDISQETQLGFKVEKPDIYFGEGELPYALVPNKLNIVDIPGVDEASSFNYMGDGGVPISSLFRKLLFSLYFKDENLFFSLNLNEKSRALFHRNIVERVQELTPFLRLDHDPYIVVTPKRLFWIMDAYTYSDMYPVSKRSEIQFNNEFNNTEINYIRNSVKIVVDAYDGKVEYYVADPTDPIIRAYRNAYPGIFKDISTLPPELMQQLRYPKDMFTAQLKVYDRYHQVTPELFYEQAETWDFAKVNDSPMRPYYFTTALEGYRDNEQSFILINPMTPIGRSNLSGLAVAGTPTVGANIDSSKGYTRQLVLYKFSREVQVDGPAQVSALIDQDPEISQQFSLWDQKGSRVLRGRIIVLPVGNSVLYVQPVYLASTSATRIPELQRIILAMGNVVVMDSSLEQGILRLEQRLKQIKRQPTGSKPVPSTNEPEANPGMKRY